MVSVLAVDSHCSVKRQALEIYLARRAEKVADRLRVALQNDVAKSWYDHFSEEELYEIGDDGKKKYLGESSGEAQTVAALQKAKAFSEPKDIVRAVEEVVLNFCGFQGIKAKCIANALHFQYETDVDRLLETRPTALSDAERPSSVDKALFDEAEVVSAELLLRVVVENEDGELVANPFSPGQPMGKLLNLPVFAQLVLVLTNAVEATLYQQELPHCPMAINVYASLLVEGAPVLQMVEGVQHVEVMEMTKGAKRGPEVVQWVKTIRESGSEVLLDDFDSSHPGVDSEPDGIKVCVFMNAFHALQVFKEGSSEMMPVPTESPCISPRANLQPEDKICLAEESAKVSLICLVRNLVRFFQGMGRMAHAFSHRFLRRCVHLVFRHVLRRRREVRSGKRKMNDKDFRDFYSLVASAQPNVKKVILEGSENCLKSEVTPGPPLNFAQPTATVASAHLCQATAKFLRHLNPKIKLCRQGGRALYDDEDFDAEALAVIAKCGKKMAAARTNEAGTMAWMGQEAVRRAGMKTRPLVCGVKKIDSCLEA